MSSRRPPPKPSRAPESKGSAARPSKPGRYSLPPVPSPPRQKFSSEPPTKQKNVAASVYQSLISVFDTMTPAQRMEFVDMASVYGGLDSAARRDFVELLALYPTLWAADRGALHELAVTLSANAEKKK